VALMLGVSALLTTQSEEASPHLVIRWTTQVALAGESEARRRVSNILGQAGISVSWRECGSIERRTARASDECNQPLEANEVVVRIVQEGSPSLGPAASLGESLVASDGRGGCFSTIFSDRVIAMAHLASVDVADVLSRVVAHEVGHLLLGTRAQTRRGLMRETWSIADFRRNAALDWVFSEDEARTMREAIVRRVADGF